MKTILFFFFTLTLVFAVNPDVIHALDMGEILSAETKSGTLPHPMITHEYSFLGEQGQAVVISMSTGSNADADPCIYLYTPDGTLEISANCGAYCVNANILEHKLQHSGEYTIVVRDCEGDDTGDYSLSLLLIPGATVSEQDPDGGEIVSAETKAGRIDPAADTDAYTFTGSEGQAVVISMSTGSNAEADPRIYLYAPDGTLEASANCGGYCTLTYFCHYLEQNGQYTIIARDYGGDNTGAYYLTLDPCIGDFDRDGDVDGSDLAVFAADFGRTDCCEHNVPPCEGDFDEDCDVDGSDLAKFAADFGRTDCPVCP